MNLLIEGVSRVGKSTVIENLATELGYKIKKYKNPVTVKNTLDLFFSYFMVLKNEDEIIFDRGHISELVYGPLFRPNNYCNSSLTKLLWKLDEKVSNATIIYLWPLSQDLLNYEGREQYKDTYNDQLDRYDWALNRTKVPVIKLSTHTCVPGHKPQWKSVGNITDHLLIKLRSIHES